MILVDTSVWIEHLRKRSDHLSTLLREEQVLCHPFILCELACGMLQRRREILDLLAALPGVPVAECAEVLHLLEAERLYGRGLGWVDVNLLASSRLARCTLWTLDKKLRRVAGTLDLVM
jgi:predicted nucleic acid-binding protein